MKRTLQKEGNKYILVEEDKENDMVLRKGYTKEKLIEIYTQLKTNQMNQSQAIAKTKKEIEQNDVKDTPELREFAEKLQDAQKMMQKTKLEHQLEKQKGEVELFKTQMEEIRKTIPEVERAKK